MDRTEVTLVTGGSSGIGRAICEALLAQGRPVVNLDYARPDWSHAKLVSFQADLSDVPATQAAAREITGAYDVTAFVNNAGATRPGTIDTATLADFDYVAALQVRAGLTLIQAALPAMRASRRGRIVNMSSRAALGKAQRVVYSTVKAGLIGLTRTLAMELGADGITVNAIAPGPIATDLFHKSNPPDAPATKRIIDSIVVRRLGTPQDVAHATLFFLSPDNGFVTGQVLYVCGGTTLGVAPV
jgi:NAD(P)-dependent dehydrogenase (short-subunit alcohol dehydrogenase family)